MKVNDVILTEINYRIDQCFRDSVDRKKMYPTRDFFEKNIEIFSGFRVSVGFLRRVSETNVNRFIFNLNFDIKDDYSILKAYFGEFDIIGKIDIVELCKELYATYPYFQIKIVFSSSSQIAEDFDGSDLINYLLSTKGIEQISLIGLERYCSRLTINSPVNCLQKLEIDNFLHQNVNYEDFVSLHFGENTEFDNLRYFSGKLDSMQDLEILFSHSNNLNAIIIAPFEIVPFKDRKPWSFNTLFYYNGDYPFPSHLCASSNTLDEVIYIVDYKTKNLGLNSLFPDRLEMSADHFKMDYFDYLEKYQNSHLFNYRF